MFGGHPLQLNTNELSIDQAHDINVMRPFFFKSETFFHTYASLYREGKNRDISMQNSFPQTNLQTYEEIVAAHHTYIYNLAYQLCNNKHDAEDLTQETFIRVFQHLDRFRGDASLRTWISKIAVNIFLAKKRKKGEHKSVSFGYITPEDSSADPERVIVRREFQWCIHHILEQHMPKPYKVVLVLRDLNEFSYKEISSMLEVPVTTVKSRIHRARKAYRDHLLKSGCVKLVKDYTCYCDGAVKRSES